MPITGLPWFEADLPLKALVDPEVAPTLKVSGPVKAITTEDVALSADPQLAAITQDEDDFLAEYDCGD